MMADAFDASLLVDDIQGAIAFANGFGWAFRDARTAGDAFLIDLHGHGNILLCENSHIN
jgi:hypothetical protein